MQTFHVDGVFGRTVEGATPVRVVAATAHF